MVQVLLFNVVQLSLRTCGLLHILPLCLAPLNLINFLYHLIFSLPITFLLVVVWLCFISFAQAAAAAQAGASVIQIFVGRIRVIFFFIG